MAEYNYKNMNPKYDDTRYKVNNAIIRMMNANPYLGVGYLIGNALGENYWGRKQNKTGNDTVDRFYKEHGIPKGSVGADATNGVYGTNNNSTVNEAMNEAGRSAGSMSPMERRAKTLTDMRDYLKSQGKTSGTVRPSEVAEWKAKNDILNSMSNGAEAAAARNLYPKTPAQNNQAGITVGNVGNGGGVTSVADAWSKMTNGSAYNYGGTPIANPTGARDLGNVIGVDANGVYGVRPAGSIGADANGVYGVGNAAPSVASFPTRPQAAPPAAIPYTAEQLAQIQAQGYSPEELRRMGAGSLVAPAAAAASAQGGGYVAPATGGNVTVAPGGNEVSPSSLAYGNEMRGLEGNVPGAMGVLNTIMEAAKNGIVPEDEAALADALRAADRYQMGASTRAGASNYNNRYGYSMPGGHDDSLTLEALYGRRPVKYDPDLYDKD